MMFDFLDLRTKKLLLLLLSLLLCWWLFFAPATCSASAPEPMYQISETELLRWEANLQKLKQLSTTQKTESKRLQEQLTILEQELQTLKNQLATSSTQLTQAQKSLQTANQLLTQFAQEEKNKRLKIKAQRNAYFVLMVAAAAYAVCHR